MEAELVRSKNDMMSLNNQLLEAIQRKLELSQELEAWQVRSLSLHMLSLCHKLPIAICKHISCFMKPLIIAFNSHL